MSTPDSDLDASSPRVVKLKRNNEEYKILQDQLNAESLRRIFSISPDSVWLWEEYTSRLYFPDHEGSFHLHETGYLILYVEGSPHAQTATSLSSPSFSSTSTPGPSFSIASTPGLSFSFASTPGPSGSGTTLRAGSQLPPYFRSVIPAGRGKEPTLNLMIILARMAQLRNGKCSFTAESQMFVELTEGTAVASHILMVVRRQWGEHITLVSNDGLEFEDSPGSAGLKFWKAPRRKVYTVSRSDLEQRLRGKRSLPIMLEDSDDDDMPGKEIKPIDKQFQSMQEDITEIVSTVRAIRELDKDSVVPLSLKQLIRDAFKCKICLRVPLEAPPIISKCCKTILGCERCVNEWYSGDEALTKSCPLCRTERGYTETIILRGTDEFFAGISTIMLPNNDNSSDQ